MYLCINSRKYIGNSIPLLFKFKISNDQNKGNYLKNNLKHCRPRP